MVLHIKYMVSNRCKMILSAELALLGMNFQRLDLGEVEMRIRPTPRQIELLKCALLKSGLELIVDKKTILVEKIKAVIIEMVHFPSTLQKNKNSYYISQKIHQDYTYLANVFSLETGNTIEHYIISHKIERVKELLKDNQLTLTKISIILNYSSVAHLSRQFKKVTGITPSCFKKHPSNIRIALEDI